MSETCEACDCVLDAMGGRKESTRLDGYCVVCAVDKTIR